MIVGLAGENPRCGYQRIVGELKFLGRRRVRGESIFPQHLGIRHAQPTASKGYVGVVLAPLSRADCGLPAFRQLTDSSPFREHAHLLIESPKG